MAQSPLKSVVLLQAPSVAFSVLCFLWDWAVSHMYFSPCWPGLAEGELYACSYFRKGCLHNLMTYWYSHIPKGKVTLQSPLCGDKFDCMPLDTRSCISFSSSSPLPISSEPSFLVEVCSSLRQDVSFWACCKCVPGGPVSTWRGACLQQLLLASKLNTCFGHLRWMCPSAQRWAVIMLSRKNRKEKSCRHH